MKTPARNSILVAAAVICTAFAAPVVSAQSASELQADKPEIFKLAAKEAKEFSLDLKADDLCNITSDATIDLPLTLTLIGPDNKPLLTEGDPTSGYAFVVQRTGRYRLIFRWAGNPEANAEYLNKPITVRYSNKLDLPKTVVSKAVRNVNGYEAKILNEPGDSGGSFLLIEKGGKIKAVMRGEHGIGEGFYFSDDPDQAEGAEKSFQLMRTTPDKTGDGTPDISVEYYTGGAHCCFETTFFELGSTVRQLPTIETANDRLTAIAKRPGGGLRFAYAEQSFAYWTINFAQSPMPLVIYEFKNDELVPRFDLMKKPAPTLAVLKRKAAAAKAKMNLHPYTNPDDNFNDFAEAFWGEMLDLIYTGHEDLAWQYFEMVWPAKKAGKQRFLADFREQLSKSAYGNWKGMQK